VLSEAATTWWWCGTVAKLRCSQRPRVPQPSTRARGRAAIDLPGSSLGAGQLVLVLGVGEPFPTGAGTTLAAEQQAPLSCHPSPGCEEGHDSA
jgi:hypothetical protein